MSDTGALNCKTCGAPADDDLTCSKFCFYGQKIEISGVREEIQKAVKTERELDAVWRQALEEAVIELQKLSRDLGDEVIQKSTLRRAEGRLNALRLRGRPFDEGE